MLIKASTQSNEDSISNVLLVESGFIDFQWKGRFITNVPVEYFEQFLNMLHMATKNKIAQYKANGQPVPDIKISE